MNLWAFKLRPFATVAVFVSAALALTPVPAASAPKPSEQDSMKMVVPFDPPEAKKFQEDSLPETELTSSLLFQLIASELALQQHEYKAAYSTYMSMATETSDPRLAERASQIALVAQAPEDLKQAVLLWNKLAPGNRRAQEALIQVGIHFQEYSKILPTVKNYLSEVKDPGADILKLQNNLLISADKKKALSLFRLATEKYKNLPETKLGLAKLEGVVGNQDTALKLARESYRAKPTGESAMTLATLLLKGNPEEAKRVLDNYLAQNPSDTKIRNAYAQLLAQGTDVSRLYSLALKYPNDFDFVISVAITLSRKGDSKDATTLLNNVTNKQLKGQEQSEHVQKAYLVLSDIAAGEENYDKALDLCDEITGSLKPLASLQKANIQQKMGNDEKALEILETIPTVGNPVLQEETFLAQARILSSTKGNAAALAKLEQGIKEMPSSSNIYYDAAMMAERMNQIGKVEKYLKTAIELDPNFANAYNSLGYTLLEKTNRIKDAANYIEQAYRLEPNNPFILDSMGWLRFKQKKYQEAINYLNDSLQLTDEEDVLLHLIEAYWVSGQKEEAILALNRAKELWPNSTELRSLINRLNIK